MAAEFHPPVKRRPGRPKRSKNKTRTEGIARRIPEPSKRGREKPKQNNTDDTISTSSAE